MSDLAEQHAHTYLWIRVSDGGFAAALMAAALGIGGAHPEFAMLLVAVGTAAIVGSLVIEPATTRAAFRRSGIVPGVAAEAKLRLRRAYSTRRRMKHFR